MKILHLIDGSPESNGAPRRPKPKKTNLLAGGLVAATLGAVIFILTFTVTGAVVPWTYLLGFYCSNILAWSLLNIAYKYLPDEYH